MPRKNRRKIYTTGKPAIFYDVITENKGYKLKCIGCVFAGNDGSCTTSNGKCLKSLPECQKYDDVAGQQKTDTVL